MELCTNPKYDEAFFFIDQELDNTIYRIFNYRLVGWQMFQDAPDAKECRGTMFNITDPSSVKIVCRPPKKFFNFAEGGINHQDTTSILCIHEKLDGSLISTYVHDKTEVRLKSKGSIKSEQAIDAMEWLNLPENKKFKRLISKYTLAGNTINMEWTSPKNRIVIGYDKPMLRVLSMRNNEFNKTVLPDNRDPFPCAQNFVVGEDFPNKPLNELVKDMYLETSGEGYVITLENNDSVDFYQVKVKNHKYCNLHKIKDSISNPVALAELIIRGESDDVVEAFSEDTVTLQAIHAMENHVIPKFNHMVRVIEEFFKDNSHLSKKEYAIKATSDYPSYMAALMNLYIGREVDYEDFAIRNMYKFFGVKNETFRARNNVKSF